MVALPRASATPPLYLVFGPVGRGSTTPGSTLPSIHLCANRALSPLANSTPGRLHVASLSVDLAPNVGPRLRFIPLPTHELACFRRAKDRAIRSKCDLWLDAPFATLSDEPDPNDCTRTLTVRPGLVRLPVTTWEFGCERVQDMCRSPERRRAW